MSIQIPNNKKETDLYERENHNTSLTPSVAQGSTGSSLRSGSTSAKPAAFNLPGGVLALLRPPNSPNNLEFAAKLAGFWFETLTLDSDFLERILGIGREEERSGIFAEESAAIFEGFCSSQ